ncbi:protein SCAR2 [Cajanus cajan]|uniref:protein SCAR2 n=1 Tax=Cajanus cajan TaxID=3821 RepID=UPI00098D7748|nr:protein SCAR2 [Cajanus cajan]
MPLSKYSVRNEYSLADPELYRAADKDDPEALLEAVAMAGLVGLLRQLGDLAEFAAEIFHDLHEEVMATSARGHGLMARVKQLEAEVPSLEKAFFSQTHHSSFYTNGGIDWHPNLRSEQNLVTRGDLPRFIMDSYEECRGPPRLFLLDKFDVAGAGACLKRYTDPSFFKMETSSVTAAVEVQREKRIRKVKLKKGARLRDGEAPNAISSHTKLHQLLLEERIENGYSNPARLVKLKKRQLNGPAVEQRAGKSYMEKFLETPSPDHKMICETSIFPLPVKLTSEDTTEAGIKILEISSISPVKKSFGNKNTCSSPNEQEVELKPYSEMDDGANQDLVKVKEQISAGMPDNISSNHLNLPDEPELAIDEQKKIEGSLDGYHSDDVTSEVDNYMDALTTMESELETDNEYKPKNSFLNVQKAANTSDKEEHQLQAQFSDSQSFGDSSMSDDTSSFKQGRNEVHIEVQAQSLDSQSTGTSTTLDNNNSFRRDGDGQHIEPQAHLSDSQSVGNSSTSDENGSFMKDRSYFPHSDSLSTVVENTQSETVLITNTKYYQPEDEDTPSNQLPQNVEFQNTDCGRFVMHDDAHGHEEEISDLGQATSDLMTSGQALCSDLGSTSPVILPAGTQLDETPSGPVELDLRLDDDDADRSGLVEAIAPEAVSLSLIKDEACPVDSSDKTLFEKLDGDDPFIHSDDLLQVSNDLELELAHGDECSDHSKIKMFQAEPPNENISEILVNRGIGSQGDDPVCPSMEELNMNSGAMLALDCRDSKDEDCAIATHLKSETPVVKISPESCFTGELSSDSTHNTQEEPGSAEIDVSHSDLQSKFEEIPKMVHDDELNESTCSVDPLEDDGHFKHPSPDNHVIINDLVTENVQSEDQAVYSVPSVDSAENDMGIVTCPASSQICSSSRVLSDSEEPLSSSDSYQMEMKSDVELSQISMDSNAEKKENQLEPSLDVTSSDVIYSPISNINKLEESLSTFADPHKKEMEVDEPVARESLTELDEQKIVDQPKIASEDVQLNLNKLVPCDLPDSKIRNDTNKLEESLSTFADPHKKEVEVDEPVARESLTEVDEQKIVDQPEIASEDVQLNLNKFVPCDLPDSKICNDIQKSSPREKFQHNAFVDSELVPEISELDTRQSESVIYGQHDPLQNDRDSFSSPSGNLLESETDSEFAKSQTGEQDVEFLVRDEKNLGSEKSQYQQMQIYQLEQESAHATSECVSEIHADEPPVFLPLPQSSSQEINAAKHVMDPLKPLLPNLLPKATENNIDEMPPMPPLPPMQWRMGKVQHASLATQSEELESTQASVLPMQPTRPDKNSLFGLPTSESETLLYQNPFLPVMAVEGDKLQHSSGFSVGVSGHPVAIPFQLPIMVNESNGQYNYLLLDRNQIQNPFLTFPVASTGIPPHNFIVAPEGEMMQNSNPHVPIPAVTYAVSGHDFISPLEKSTQLPHQSMMETSGDDKSLQQGMSNNMVSMERLPHGHAVASEGKMVLNSNPCPTIPCSVSGHDSDSLQEKLTQPPSQLTTEPSSDDKTLVQSATNVVSLDSPHSHIASEGEMVSNSNPDPIPPVECDVPEPVQDSISSQEKLTQPQLVLETTSEVKTLDQSISSAEGEQGRLPISFMSSPHMECMEPNQSFLSFEGGMATSADTSDHTSDVESERTNGKPKNKLPRPRNPLIDAVAAHDKSKLRRVTERVMPQIAPKVDERDSLLEQIRTKSFNLKPAVTTRPSIQGPKTNLKLAAILEKANAIRQALAGSDEDDEDWSDS